MDERRRRRRRVVGPRRLPPLRLLDVRLLDVRLGLHRFGGGDGRAFGDGKKAQQLRLVEAIVVRLHARASLVLLLQPRKQRR